jgi:replicative superfamily II helicase
MSKRVKAYITQMSYDVSDAEKNSAMTALHHFDHAMKLLQLSNEHLNIMKTPFKNNPGIDPQDIMKARVAIRRFRDKSVDNFNIFKKAAFQCVHAMQEFASDTQTLKLMKSFISSIDDLEVKVNSFVDLFSDLEAKDFSTQIVSSIEDIQQQCSDIEEIIDERIKDHIQQNILATNWTDSVGKEMQMTIEPKVPLILDLFNQRQDQLNEAIRERGTKGN